MKVLVVIVFFYSFVGQASDKFHLRVERPGKYGRTPFYEVSRDVNEWVCHTREFRAFFPKQSPLENWTREKILTLKANEPCANPATIWIPGAIGGRRIQIKACASDHPFEELWAQLVDRCGINI